MAEAGRPGRRAGIGSSALWCLLAVAALAGCRADQTPEARDTARRLRIERMYERYHREFPDTPDVTVQELLAMRCEGRVVVVDGRTPEEQVVSVIPGAVLLEELERRLQDYRARPVEVYCTVGYRSGLKAQELRARGLDAYNLRGGILAWTHAGQPVVDPAGRPTRRVHVYGRRWSLAPEAYEAVW